jgi:hypothetical protein
MSFCSKVAMLLPVLSASGAFGEGVFVNPLRYEIVAPRGAVHEERITLRNDGNATIRLRVGLQEETAGERRHWIEANLEPVELRPGEMCERAFFLEIPDDAFGELRARIIFSGEEKEGGGGVVQVAARLAVPVYVMIKGTEVRAAEVLEIRECGGFPGWMEVVVENKGNVHIRPAGELRILDADGRAMLVRAPVNEWGYPVLPGEIVALRAGPMDGGCGPGPRLAEAALNFDGSKLTSRHVVQPLENIEGLFPGIGKSP